MKNDFLLHLAWSERLSTAELCGLIDAYQQKVEMELAMCQEKVRRQQSGQGRSAREGYVWGMIRQNRVMLLQAELNWLARLRSGLASK